MDASVVGLRAELRDHYENGRCIQTTSVHPGWHATGMTARHRARMEKNGVKMAPASDVSDAVIEQVLAGRSGRIFMPRGEARHKMDRNWPFWLQDAVAHLNDRSLIRGR